MIDELAAVVRVEAEDRHGDQGARVSDRGADDLLAAIAQRNAFGPLGDEVGEHKGV